MSALARMALDDHKDVQIDPGDTVVLSARMIPGNERAITRMMDHFYRRHADIYYPDGAQPPVHVSGHASEEELKLVITLVKPKYFIPIHGMYRQLHRHAKLAEKTSAVQEKRDHRRNRRHPPLQDTGAEIVGKAPVGRVLIDEGSLEEVGEVVIRDRKHISEDGIVLSHHRDQQTDRNDGNTTGNRLSRRGVRRRRAACSPKAVNWWSTPSIRHPSKNAATTR